MAASKKKAMTDEELVFELRSFHHYEAARRLEQLARSGIEDPTLLAEPTLEGVKP